MAEKPIIEISTDGLTLIGQGANADIYRLDEDKIVKLYSTSVKLPLVERERRFARTAFINGIPSAITYNLVRCSGRYGIIFEYLNADTLGRAFTWHPERRIELLDKYVSFVKAVHDTPLKSGAFEDIKDVLRSKLPHLERFCGKEECSLLEALISQIPEGSAMIHGDLHPGNIMIFHDELMLIDLADVTMGTPLWDLIGIFRDMVIAPMNPTPELERSIGMPAPMISEIGRSFFASYFGLENEEAVDGFIQKMIPLYAFNTVLFFADRGEECENVIKYLMREAVVPRAHEIGEELCAINNLLQSC